MEYKKFAKMITHLKNQESKVSKAYALKVDLIDFNDDLNNVIEILLEEAYGKEGADWISWFRFESEYGKKDYSAIPTYKTNKAGKMTKVPDSERSKYGAHDENGKPICYSVKSTWKYVEENYGKSSKKN